jgi:hypothetical protein
MTFSHYTTGVGVNQTPEFTKRDMDDMAKLGMVTYDKCMLK